MNPEAAVMAMLWLAIACQAAIVAWHFRQVRRLERLRNQVWQMTPTRYSDKVGLN